MILYTKSNANILFISLICKKVMHKNTLSLKFFHIFKQFVYFHSGIIILYAMEYILADWLTEYFFLADADNKTIKSFGFYSGASLLNT